MTKKRKLCSAVLSVTSVIAASHVTHAAKLEEVVVTATKRTESAQDIPVAVQALSQESLKELNVGNFDDYVRYLPNVNAGGRGPGQSTIFIRGMAVQPITVMLSGAQGTMPNVALYLDEQPVTAPGRNLDVYVTDIERVEVLPGPQGTLYGASSQAGTVRLITNKPRVNEFQAGFEASVAQTKDGEMSNTQEAYINLPILENRLAVRAAFYNVNEGGYIDNVQGSFTTDPAINPDSTVPPEAGSTYETAHNTALVEKDFNDSYYKGVRFGLKYLINENWDFLLQHTQQELGADGVFDYDPDVGELEVQRFFPDELEESFGQTSWTVQGRLAALELLYTGAYLDREVEQSIDYTGYNNSGAFIEFYTCTTGTPRECLTPVKGFKGQQKHIRQTHEFRISTPRENRWRLTAGIFYDDFEIETLDDFLYLATPDLGFVPNAPIAAADNIEDGTRPPGVAFYNDITRTEEQIAAFGEFSFDFIPNFLSGTLGLRYYDMESDFSGSSNFANKGVDSVVEGAGGRDYDSTFGHSDDPLKAHDFIPKVSVSITPTPELMFYATYSEGFRPGGFNRGGGAPSNNPAFPRVDVTYETDDVVNQEVGWKTMLLDGALRFNGNIYYIEWTDMQISRFDPQNVSILTFIENGADSEIRGMELDATWRPTDRLTLFGAFSYNDTEVTDVNAQIVELAPEGSELPLTPEFQAAVRLRYDWQLGQYQAHGQVGVQYAEDSYSSLVADDRRKQDSYTTADASFGLSRDQWGAELYVENLTDERAELFINNQDDIERITTNRPRTIGLRVSYDY